MGAETSKPEKNRYRNGYAGSYDQLLPPYGRGEITNTNNKGDRYGCNSEDFSPSIFDCCAIDIKPKRSREGIPSRSVPTSHVSEIYHHMPRSQNDLHSSYCSSSSFGVESTSRVEAILQRIDHENEVKSSPMRVHKTQSKDVLEPKEPSLFNPLRQHTDKYYEHGRPPALEKML
mmetsp:Transcript_83797/g.135840  ORF Transcript_83797/g.135840 Transcript_83797/m.135840 type:complete len:174 (-) Transcript_83797:167-688(-)